MATQMKIKIKNILAFAEPESWREKKLKSHFHNKVLFITNYTYI